MFVLVRILQRNRTDNLYINKKGLLQGFDSCNYEGWEVPWSVTCKLQTQENDDVVQRPDNQTADGADPSLNLKAWEPRVPRTEEYQCPSSTVRQNNFNLPLIFCFIQALNRLDHVHTYWRGPTALLSSPIQMLISLRNTLTDTPQNNFNQIARYIMAHSS